jgi:threonine/homoserine/homoserine lactone efflux protein
MVGLVGGFDGGQYLRNLRWGEISEDRMRGTRDPMTSIEVDHGLCHDGADGRQAESGFRHLITVAVAPTLSGIPNPTIHTMSLIAFLVAALVLAITPGPGIAYVIARTVSGGRAEGLASCFGTAMGGLLHVLAAAMGLSLLVAESAVAFNVVKYLGAGYLVYLGVRLLLQKDQGMEIISVAAQGPRRALFEGIVVELLNVKTALFFLAFLPQFVNPSEPIVPQLVLLGSICVVFNTLVDIVAVLSSVHLLSSQSARDARARWLTRVSGTTMVALGAFLALSKRDT